jgi:ADP-ribose pyrophosphatase
MTKIAEFYTTPGYSDERFHLFFAGECRVGERTQGDEEEKDMGVVRVPLDDAVAMARNGAFEDGKTIAGIILGWLHLRGEP